jgi:hypothetical protein
MKHLEEDWEMLPKIEQMYIIEKQREEEEQYQQWLEDQERKPATVEIIYKNKKKHEKSGRNRL